MSDETARLIEQTADDLFAAEGEAARAALAGGAWPEQLWQTFAETGLAQAALPEAAGGAGLAAGLAVLRAAGRHAAPIPVAETLIGTLLCHAAGIEAPAGPVTLHASPVRGDPDVATLQRVPWARFATAIVVVMPGAGLAVCKPADLIEGANLAGEPRDDVTLAGPLEVSRLPPTEADGFALMALARAAQLRGAMEQVLAMSLRYAREREQFGRPLARFQAIQHSSGRDRGRGCRHRGCGRCGGASGHALRLRGRQGAGEPGSRHGRPPRASGARRHGLHRGARLAPLDHAALGVA